MVNNSIIRQVFGNHNDIRNYLEFLNAQRNGEDMLPPFKPVLYRAIAYIGGSNDDETIIINDKSHHKAKNKQVKAQLIQQFERYSQLIYPVAAE